MTKTIRRHWLTGEDVRAAVQRIYAMAGDNESAHGAEDDIYKAVLLAIAQGRAINPAECAHQALKAADIEFTRWYA